MNKYFSGFMSGVPEENSKINTSRPAEQIPVINRNRSMTNNRQNNSTEANNLSENNNQSNENTSSNNPLYPVNDNKSQESDNSLNFNNQSSAHKEIQDNINKNNIMAETFNKGLAEGLQTGSARNVNVHNNNNSGNNNVSSNNDQYELFTPTTDGGEQTKQMPFTGQGSLIIQAFTADQALPIENVKITITSNEPQTESINEVRYTNSSGRTEPVFLPAPSLFFSQQPQSTFRPYAVYNILSEIEGYTSSSRPQTAMVFDKIESIQNISLIPNRGNQE